MNTKRIALSLARSLRGGGRTLGSVALVLAAVAMLVVGVLPRMSFASSHREAPFISTDPQADNTDLYAFVSPDLTNTVTIIANYIPLEQPAGGPNFYTFGDDVLYELKIDNTGNGEADISYQFRFHTTHAAGDATFLYNNGPITSINDATYLQKTTYTVTRVEHGLSTTVAHGIVPPVNIGPRSTPNYEVTAMQGVTTTTNGGKVFAGQRDDPFYVDLGSVFDLAGLRPFNSLHAIPISNTAGVDGVAGYNGHAIALQVPITDLTKNHQAVSGAGAANAVVGIWATASRYATRILQKDGTHSEGGQWVQVSRLGNPLINEVLIPYNEKDYWNASKPADDKYFQEYYTDPGIVPVLNSLYAALDDADAHNRADLVGVLLTGLPGSGPIANFNYTGTTRADMLRLNMGIPVSANPSRLGPLDPSNPDVQGFPNGRRLADDVTDIEIRALEQGYGATLNTLYGVPNRTPNNLLADGVDANDKAFKSTFPYSASPWGGYEAVPPTP